MPMLKLLDHVTLTRGAGALAVATNKLASTSVPESKVLPPARWAASARSSLSR